MNTILERRKKMESYNRLLEHNIKPSMQRIAIMNYLMEHKTHPSADEIYDCTIIINE